MHNAKLIAKRQDADTSVSTCARCCNDPATDSWHTVADVHLHTVTGIQEQLRIHLANVEAKHEAMLQAQTLIDSIIIEGN